jgi:hypothetical protein
MLGDIDLVWGDPGDERNGGYGLSHIAAKHPEVVQHLQTALDKARIHHESGSRIVLRSKKYHAVVALARHGQKQRWLLTAFKRSPGG